MRKDIQTEKVFRGFVDGHEVALELAGPSLVRLRVSAGERLAADVSYAIDRTEFPASDFQVKEVDGGAHIATKDLSIELVLNPFSLVIKDQSGSIRFQTSKDALGFTENGITLRRKFAPQERVYGLGETGETFDRSGYQLSQWNTDDPAHHPRQNFYCQIPFSIHLTPDATPPHAEFVDNTSRMNYDFGHDDPEVATLCPKEGDLVLWLMFEDSPEALLREWTALTGRMERPPLWALGYQQCRWSYYPESRIRELAQEFRTRRIPCDVLFLDIDYMDGYRVFTWDAERFSDPKKMMADLLDDGFRIVTIVDPGVKIDKGYPVYDEFSTRDGFLVQNADGSVYEGEVWPGATVFPDFTRQDVRDRWADYQEETLLSQGVSGIWNDMNEPATFRPEGFPLDATQDDFGSRRPHSAIHQIWGLTMAKTSHEGFKRTRPNERPFIITRSGWAGVQRHAMVWTGDNQSVWRNQAFDIMVNLNMGMSGVAHVGCDIGGFTYDCHAELYARWIEWGVFQPFCRTHTATGTRDQEPWSFGPGVEKVARRMIEARMRLLPYLYTQFCVAAETGAPINRPLVFQHPEDAMNHKIGDQFLVGPDLLVAPVTEPGMDRRMVYLPAGEWFHYWSNRKIQGAQWIIETAKWGQPPVYVRAGAVIPHWPVLQSTAESQGADLYLDVWQGARLSGSLIEDDGATQDWRKGVEARYAFTGHWNEKELKLTIPTPHGSYTAPDRQWKVRAHGVGALPQSVHVNGVEAKPTLEGTTLEWTIPAAAGTTPPWESVVTFKS